MVAAFQPISCLDSIDDQRDLVKKKKKNHNYSQSDSLLKELLYFYSKADKGLFQDNLLDSFVKNIMPRKRNNVIQSLVSTVTFSV